nr:reverse transcriptase domain-containing protein [Tanacetum cinerariifolium]
MRTRSSSNIPVESPPNPSTSNPKRRNCKCSKQPFILEESPVDTMVDQRTMTELLRAPTEGYAEAIVARDRYKDILRACPHHGFIKLHQLDTFYNALNPTDQDSLHSAAGGNLLERHTQDVLTIIENKSKIAKLTHAVNQRTSVVTTAMIAILKQFQATRPPASVKAVEEMCVTCGGAHPYYQCLAADGNTLPKLRDNIQGYVAAAAVNYNQSNFGYRPPVFFQMNTASTLRSGSLPSNTIANPKGELKAITTRSGIVLDGPSVPIPPPFINLDEDEPVILKKLPEKLGDPRKFLIPYGFGELKCKALADQGASINLMPLSVWKKLGLPELISTRITLKLANRAICTPAGIARDVFILVSKFTFLADFVIVDYESDPRVPLILGRPFLRTARALIDVHGEEMILRDGDERLTLNMRHDTSSYSNQPQKESINLINVFNDSNSIDQSNLADLNDNLVDSMPEMFTDEHALDYSSPPLYDEYDDDLFKVESDTEYV